MGPKNYYHNKGQEDYAAGKYEPPHGLLEDILTWSESGTREISEDNGAYDEGYGHAQSQDP